MIGKAQLSSPSINGITAIRRNRYLKCQASIYTCTQRPQTARLLRPISCGWRMRRDLTASLLPTMTAPTAWPLRRRPDRECGVRVIAGIEFNTTWVGQSVHILGYFVGSGEPRAAGSNCAAAGRQTLSRPADSSRSWPRSTCRLTGKPSYERADGGAVGRPHIAKAMIAQGYVRQLERSL